MTGEGATGQVHKEGNIVVRVGDTFPSVSLPSTSGRSVNLRAEADTHHIVLFWYPGDREGIRYPELSGCSAEGRSFRDNIDAIGRFGVVIYGVNFHSTERQREFVERESLNFELLSDANHELAQALGIPIWTSNSGEKFASRNTFLIRKGGQIAKVFPDLATSEGHVEDVLVALEEL